MANIPIDEAPNLNLDMENFTDKTPVHFDEMNNRHKQHLNNEKALLYPTFDDSGTASGISSFNDFIATVKNRMRLFDFFKNFKSGMQFVMHLGRAANNCSTTAEGLYLDARQGKVLMDLYTKLNSDLVLKANASDLANTNSNLTGIQNNFTVAKAGTVYQDRCDNLNGGYVKFGRLVIVSLQFRVLASGENRAMVVDLPAPLLTNGNVPVEMNGIKTLSFETTGVYINSVGTVCVKNAVVNDYISVSGSYLSAYL